MQDCSFDIIQTIVSYFQSHTKELCIVSTKGFYNQKKSIANAIGD